MGIFEILLILVIALIVIPPDDLPGVVRAVGKVLRELRLASNTVMRELSSAIGDDSPYNLLPPRLDTRVPQSIRPPTQTPSAPDAAAPPDAPPVSATAAQPAEPVVSPAPPPSAAPPTNFKP